LIILPYYKMKYLQVLTSEPEVLDVVRNLFIKSKGYASLGTVESVLKEQFGFDPTEVVDGNRMDFLRQQSKKGIKIHANYYKITDDNNVDASKCLSFC